MQIDELTLSSALRQGGPTPSEVAWFAARQPGVLRYLEEALGMGDAFVVALDAAWRLCTAVELREGAPPGRVPSSLIERASDALETEALAPRGAAGGCADRQPVLCAWVVDLAARPRLPLDRGESLAVGSALLAIIYAFDEMTSGRPVP